MRQPLFLSALVGVLTAAPAFAQTQAATIMQKEVEVRSGPSTTFQATSKLTQNDRVLVLRESKEAPGWLEIVPPAGSFSWINAKHVKFAKQGDRIGAVDPDPAQLVATMPGTVLPLNQPPNREGMKLAPGTAIELIERPLTIKGETWLPIKPHPDEVRYIPASAVAGAVTVAPTTVAPGTWNLTPSGWAKNPTVAEADRQLAAGNKEGAKQFYWQAASSESTDPNNKAYAQNQYARLANPTVPATTTSLSPANLAPITPAKLQTLKGPDWSVYGRLGETKLTSDNGQPLYALDDGRGGLPTYVTMVPGKSLQSFVGRWISVYGPTLYRPDVRMKYIVASHVAQP